MKKLIFSLKIVAPIVVVACFELSQGLFIISPKETEVPSQIKNDPLNGKSVHRMLIFWLEWMEIQSGKWSCETLLS